jgi:hypothetical protein
MAYIVNFYVEAGASFSRSVTYTNRDGTLFDLSDYTAELQVRLTPQSATKALTIIPTIDVETATISWAFTPSQTSTLTASSYVYAMELTKDDGSVIRLIEGSLTISPEVVR